MEDQGIMDEESQGSVSSDGFDGLGLDRQFIERDALIEVRSMFISRLSLCSLDCKR